MNLRNALGRPVFDPVVEGDGVDGYFSRATNEDGTPLTDDELDYLTNAYPDYIAEALFEMAIGRAESHGEGDR